MCLFQLWFPQGICLLVGLLGDVSLILNTVNRVLDYLKFWLVSLFPLLTPCTVKKKSVCSLWYIQTLGKEKSLINVNVQ